MIAFDTSTFSISQSWAHSCNGTDRLLVVSSFDPANGTSTASYNGVPMTLIAKQAIFGGFAINLFYLLNPPAGSHTISLSGSTAGASSSYTGVAQYSQPDSFGLATAGSFTNCPTSTTVAAKNCWLIGAHGAEGSNGLATLGILSGHIGQSREEHTYGSNHVFGFQVFDSDGIVGTGTQTMDPAILLGNLPWNQGCVLASFAPSISSNGLFMVSD